MAKSGGCSLPTVSQLSRTKTARGVSNPTWEASRLPITCSVSFVPVSCNPVGHATNCDLHHLTHTREGYIVECMIRRSLGKLLSLSRLSVLLGIFFALFLFGNVQAAARPMMDHDGHNDLANCITLCTRGGGAPIQEQAVLEDDQAPEPDPIITDAQYFSGLPEPEAPNAIRPAPNYSSSPLRPPDTLALHATLRI